MSIEIQSSFGDTDQRIVLGVSQYAQKLSIGSTWNKLRIGARFAFDDLGGNAAAMDFYFGLMSNPNASLDNGPLGNETSNYIGWRSQTDFVRVAGPPATYSMTTSTKAATKVGSTITPIGGNIVSRVSATPASLRLGILAEITKGTPWTIAIASHPATTIADISLAGLIGALENASFTTGATSINLAGSVAVNATVDEVTNGYIDSICVGWSRSDFKVYFSEVLFAVHA